MKYMYIKQISELLLKYDLMNLVGQDGPEDEYDLEAKLIIKKCRVVSAHQTAGDILKIFQECFSYSINLDEEKLKALSAEVLAILKEINKNNRCTGGM